MNYCRPHKVKSFSSSKMGDHMADLGPEAGPFFRQPMEGEEADLGSKGTADIGMQYFM